jgi:hypothetical protein
VNTLWCMVVKEPQVLDPGRTGSPQQSAPAIQRPCFPHGPQGSYSLMGQTRAGGVSLELEVAPEEFAWGR